VTLGVASHPQHFRMIPPHFDDQGFRKGSANIKCGEELSMIAIRYRDFLLVILIVLIRIIITLFAPSPEAAQTVKKIFHQRNFLGNPCLNAGGGKVHYRHLPDNMSSILHFSCVSVRYSTKVTRFAKFT